MAQIVLDGCSGRRQPLGGQSIYTSAGEAPVQEQNLPLWRQWRRACYFRLAQAVLLVGQVLPDSVGSGFCESLARVAVWLRPRDWARAKANLRIAFPELGDNEQTQLLRMTTLALGRNLYQTTALAHSADKQLETVCGAGTIEEIRRLRQHQHGVLILTGHIGCWELLGAYLAKKLGHLGVVTGTIHNRRVDELVQGWRKDLGMTVLPRAQGVRPVIRMLRDGGVVAVLLDQATGVNNQAVPFFGKSAQTPASLAKLAIRYRIPVLPVCIGRTETGHCVQHLDPLPLATPSGKLSVQEFLVTCNIALETMIRRNSSEWVWFHKRWNDDILQA